MPSAAAAEAASRCPPYRSGCGITSAGSTTPTPRAAKPHGFLSADRITEERLTVVRALDAIARERGQRLAQLAIAWVLREPVVTSALIGASRVAQLSDAALALAAPPLSEEELARIEATLHPPPAT